MSAIEVTQNKLALLIGNSYCKNDVSKLSKTLEIIGFATTRVIVASSIEMQSAIDTFVERITDETVVLFFFAGYGIKLDGENYLTPIGNVQNQKGNLIKAQQVLDDIMNEKPAATLFLLDCYHDPSIVEMKSRRDNRVALADMRIPTGSLVTISCTSERSISNNLEDSVFTSRLLKHITEPNMDMRKVMRKVCDHVAQDTNGKQRIQMSESILTELVLNRYTCERNEFIRRNSKPTRFAHYSAQYYDSDQNTNKYQSSANTFHADPQYPNHDRERAFGFKGSLPSGGFKQIAVEELINILKPVWNWLIRPLISLSIILGIMYAIYIYFVCSYGCWVPLLCQFCPSDDSLSIRLPPFSKIGEETASLAEELVNTDLSASVQLVRAKTAIVAIRAKLKYSDIQLPVRNELVEGLEELKGLLKRGAEQLSSMLAFFGSAIDKMKIYIKFTLENLFEWTNEVAQVRQRSLGYSEIDIQNSLYKSFQDGVTSVLLQVEQILEKAEIAFITLLEIDGKLETLHDLAQKGGKHSADRLQQLEHGSFWSNLFDEGSVGIAKYKRNLNLLHIFGKFLSTVMNSVGQTIDKLRSFKSDVEQLQVLVTHSNHIPHLSIKEQTELLQIALRRLTQSKEAFMEKRKRSEQSHASVDPNQENVRSKA